MIGETRERCKVDGSAFGITMGDLDSNDVVLVETRLTRALD